MRARIIGPARAGWPSGGSIYNEHIAQHWGVGLETLPGSWPDPSDRDVSALVASLTACTDDEMGQGCQQNPVLLDGLIGCAAPGALATARASGVRVVLLVHLPLPAETGWSPGLAADVTRREGQALHEASAVACTSGWAAADLHRRYGTSSITVAEPGTTSADIAVGSNPPVLLTPAAFTPRKNHAFLLTALADRQVRDLDWSATWVGAEPISGRRETVRRGVVGAGLAHRIEVAAAMSARELDALYAVSNLVLLPSLAETYAMVLTEGFARGIPAIVGADTGAAATLAGGLDRVSRTPAPPEATAPGVASPALPGSVSSGPALPWSAALGAALPGAALPLDDPGVWAETLRAWLTQEATRARWRDAALARRAELPTWAEAAHTLRQLMHPEAA
ncbi:glycosyltransferase family 4 protein [soil metagenome]